MEIISFFSFSNNSKKIKNSKISPLAVYSIFCIFEADFRIRKMKKWLIFLTIFFFSIFFCTFKYVHMITISDISFFRFCWKNRKLDWPKCARTISSAVHHFNPYTTEDLLTTNGLTWIYIATTLTLTVTLI